MELSHLITAKNLMHLPPEMDESNKVITLISAYRTHHTPQIQWDDAIKTVENNLQTNGMELLYHKTQIVCRYTIARKEHIEISYKVRVWNVKKRRRKDAPISIHCRIHTTQHIFIICLLANGLPLPFNAQFFRHFHFFLSFG